ncbi:MAG: hypothetical protein Q7T54_05265 [Candidatus Levybacteria bacterium]|nr:hypothetical protein [Candidatus Levybacteria bacterium]
MIESPNFPWCNGCPLPEILEKIMQSRNGALTANANILASESPTQAHPYRIEALWRIKKLRNEMAKLDEFKKSLDDNCPSCTLL